MPNQERCPNCYSLSCRNKQCKNKKAKEEVLFDYKYRCVSNPLFCERLYTDRPKYCSKCVGTRFQAVEEWKKTNDKKTQVIKTINNSPGSRYDHCLHCQDGKHCDGKGYCYKCRKWNAFDQRDLVEQFSSISLKDIKLKDEIKEKKNLKKEKEKRLENRVEVKPKINYEFN